MTRRLQVLLVAALLAITGCGNGTLSEEATADLQQRADAVRAAAEGRDVDAAEEALRGLRAALDAHAEADAVSPGRAREIAAAADAVEARLSLLVEEEVEEVPDEQAPPVEEAPTTEPRPPPSSTTTIPAPEPDEDTDEDKDKDKDKDDDNDEEGRDGEEGELDPPPDDDGPPEQSRGASAVGAIRSIRAG